MNSLFLRSRRPLALSVLGIAVLGAHCKALAQVAPVPASAAQGIRLSSPELPPAEATLPPPASPPGAGAPEPGDPPVPAVAVRVRVAASAEAGKDLEYRLIVDNVSAAPAHHVLLRVPLPAHAKYGRANPEPSARDPELQWKLGTLPARGHQEISLVLVPTGEGEIRCCARVQFEHGQCVRTQLARAALRIRKEGPARALIYDALTYRLEVTNVGAAPATDVLLTDTLPEGLEFSTSTPSTSGDNPLTWKFETLGPGQTRKIEYQVFAKKAGPLVNKAVVTAAGGQRQETSSTVTVEEAKVSAAKTGPKRRILNRPATYQISVANTGTIVLTRLEVLDEVPAAMAFEQASDGGQLVGSSVRWSLGTLAPGARRSVQVVLKGRQAGRFINRATITATPRVDLTVETETKFEGAAALSLEIDKSEDPLEVGKPATYKVRIANQGSAPATKLALTVTASEHLKILSGMGQTMVGEQTGNRLTFAPLSALAAGKDAEFTVSTKAVQAGEARLRVELTGAELTPGNPLKQEETTTVFGP